MASTEQHGRRLALVAAEGKRLASSPGSAAGTGQGLSVAILPFAGLGGPEEQQFGDGIAEDLIMEFSRFQNLTVAARASSFACRPFAGDTARVARELGVQYVLEGSVRRTGDRMRVSVRLHEGDTGRLVASERLEHPVQDLLAAQEEIARRITTGMAPEIDMAALQRAERLPLAKLRTDEMAMRARAMLLRGTEAEDAGTVNAGIELARRATERDPLYGEAWRVLAFGYCLRGERGAFGPASQADYAAADAAATRLRAIEPNSYAAHAIGGHIAMRQGRHAEALESLRYAYELNPNAVTTLRWLSWEESNHGLADAAKEHAEISLRLSPRD
ncbi:MAG TPA: hypothetical protein VGC80_09900, partial [Acetobacteraceae bacterium]